MAVVRTRSYPRTRLRTDDRPPRRKLVFALLEPVSVDITVALETGAQIQVDRTVAFESVGGLTALQADRTLAIETKTGVLADRTAAFEALSTTPIPGTQPTLETEIYVVRRVADEVFITALVR